MDLFRIAALTAFITVPLIFSIFGRSLGKFVNIVISVAVILLIMTAPRSSSVFATPFLQIFVLLIIAGILVGAWRKSREGSVQ